LFSEIIAMKSKIHKHKKKFYKKLIILLLMMPLAFGCSSDHMNNKNPYIPNYNFSVQLDMALPLYSQLQFPSNAVYYNGVDAGVRGLIVFNTGSGYVAFDRACPNQALGNCSTMTIDGIMAVCPCDDAEYSLFTGQTQEEGHVYPMKQYRVQQGGSVLTVYN
jgi:nitrite reductase/ring-hydroxylating ferredoxin subunit